MAKLSNAPEEVTEFILLELDARDILSCSAVRPTFRAGLRLSQLMSLLDMSET